MDKLNDFFKQVGERFSNPLFFSFLLSWMAWNWKVVVVLLFYSPEDVKADGFKSFNDMIYYTVTTRTGVVYPLIFAVLYTAIIPFISGGVYILNGKVKAESRKWHLKWIRTSTVSLSQYLDLEEKVEGQTKNLTQKIKDKGAYEAEKAKLVNEKSELVDKISSQSALLQMQNVKQLDGIWSMSYFTKEGLFLTHLVGISNGTLTFQDSILPEDDYIHFRMEHFMRSNNKIFFEIKFHADHKSDDFQILQVTDDLTEMLGVSRDGREFRYVRE